MKAQDTELLRVAIDEAKEAGVAHEAAVLPSGVRGATRVRSAVQWLQSVADARAAATRQMTEALEVQPSVLNLEALSSNGIAAPIESGVVDAELIAKAQTIFDEVEAMRRNATAELLAAHPQGAKPQPTDEASEHDMATLQATLEKAEAAGVAQIAYVLPSGRPGSSLVSSAREYLASLRQIRDAACRNATEATQT
eukprot:7390359-Prymnesium_polylepis.1